MPRNCWRAEFYFMASIHEWKRAHACHIVLLSEVLIWTLFELPSAMVVSNLPLLDFDAFTHNGQTGCGMITIVNRSSFPVRGATERISQSVKQSQSPAIHSGLFLQKPPEMLPLKHGLVLRKQMRCQPLLLSIITRLHNRI